MKIRKLFKYIFYLVLAYLVLHVIVYASQEKFIFLEERLHQDHRFNFQASIALRPESKQADTKQAIDFEEHFFTLDNGEKINALYFKTRDSLHGDILYFHGNADNLDRWGNYAAEYTKLGYNVLMIDYRGYGKSDGVPTETHLYEDGQIAYDWIRKKSLPENIIIYGRSLGSGVACHIAAHNPAKMLILETPFNAMKDIVQVRYPFLWLSFPFRHQFPNDQNLLKVAYPIYIFHGTNDAVVPYECAEKLKASLKPEDRFYTIENGGHKNLADFSEFHVALEGILGKKVKK